MENVNKKSIVWVGAFLENENHEYLFLRRGKNSSWGVGGWQLPGGKLEWGEEPIGGLNREISEETGSKAADALKLIGLETALVETRGNEYHVVQIIYHGKYSGSKVEIGEDHDHFKWMTLKEALTETLIANLDKFIKREMV